MSISDLRQRAERARLDHPLAFASDASRGRRFPEGPDPIRLPFERDAHRILHAKPFRRLRNKTQVFFSPENDHITTRMDHSLYVATISSTICRALGLNDDLAWAIALGHDLGHAPFGHSGEKVLHGLLREHAREPDVYMHEAQSLRVVDCLSSVTGRSFAGLNLHYEIRDGIRCHCGESTERLIAPRPANDARDPSGFPGRATLPITLEGCVVRMADRIAYLGRDYEDAQTALGELLPPFPSDIASVLGADNRGIINTLVIDVIEQNQANPGCLGFSPERHDAALALRAFNYHNIYGHPKLEEYRAKADNLLVQIFGCLFAHLHDRAPGDWDVATPDSPPHLRWFARFLAGTHPDARTTDPARCVVDYLSLMTDGFAFKTFESIVLPHPLV